MINKAISFYTKYFAVWVVVMGVVAYFFPAPFVGMKEYMTFFFGLTMFGIGAVLSIDDFKRIGERPVIVLIGSAAQFTIMPFGGFIINRVNLSAPQKENLSLDTSKLFSGTNITLELKEKLIDVHRNIQKMAQSDIRSVKNLTDKIGSEEDVLQIPCVDGEIANLDDLYRLARQFERSA